MTGSENHAEADPWNDLREQLDHLTKAHLRRALIETEVAGPVIVERDGRLLINFSSNDYLNFSQHPEVKRAAAQAIETWGTGCGASRLITGDRPVHHQLETALAVLKGTESALVFSSGYMAISGVLQTLSLRPDGSRMPTYFDRLAHACIVDGATAGGRTAWKTFPHNDVQALEQLLRSRGDLRRHGSGGFSAIVATEGVFSMDGDMAPLSAMLELCEKYGALLVVDDAHGTGTVGEGGRGSASQWGVEKHPLLVQVGTLSKALGSQGGFVAGPQKLVDLLVSRCRTFIFDTGLAPACAAAALKAMDLLKQEPQWLSQLSQLQRNIKAMADLQRQQPVGSPHCTPVFPVILGDEQAALEKAQLLEAAGYLAIAIRPPTVRPGTSRLRLTVTAGHSPAQIQQLWNTLHNL